MNTKILVENTVFHIILSIVSIMLLSSSYFLISLKDTGLEDKYKDNNNNTYLYSADTFLYYRLGRNLIEYNGNYSNIAINNSNGESDFIDKLRYGSKGHGLSFNALPYLLYLSYNLINIFAKINLEFLAFFLPVIMGVISVNLFLLISYNLLEDRRIAFIASLMLATSYFFISNNLGGYFDNQVLVFFINMLALFLFVKLILSKSLIARALYLILLVLLEFSFSYIWKGLVYVNLIFATFLISYLLIHGLNKNYKSLGKWLFIIILLFYFFGSSLIDQISDVFLSFAKLTSLSGTFSSESVVELQAVDLSIPNLYFNLILIALIIIGFISLLRKIFSSKANSEELLMLSWFAVIIIPSIISRRFVFLALPSIFLVIGAFLKEVCNKSLSKRIKLQKFSIPADKIIYAIIILLITSSFLLTLNEISAKKPVMNDAILETSEFIKNNTQEDAVINVFWDQGYIWQAYANRATLTDGGLLTLGENYWLNQALFANNESESSSIIRTTNCLIGLFTYGINNENYHPKLRELLFREIIKRPKNDSFKLAEELNITKIIDINTTHCENLPEILLIVDQDILFKVKAMSERPSPLTSNNISDEKGIIAVKTLYNISHDRAKIIYEELKNSRTKEAKVSPISSCDVAGPFVACEKQTFIINPNTLEIPKESRSAPKRVILFKDGLRKTKEVYDKADNSLVIVNYEGNNYFSFAVSDYLADSMLVRLFAGEKLNNFELLYQTSSPKRIMTYKVRN